MKEVRVIKGYELAIFTHKIRMYLVTRIQMLVSNENHEECVMGSLRNVCVNAVNIISQYQKMFHFLTRKTEIYVF